MKKNLTILIGLASILLTFYLHGQIKAKKLDPSMLGVKPSITVQYPNGGQKWEKAGKYRIQWTSKGIKTNVKIKLKWGTGHGGWYTITKSTDNDGSYDYTVSTRIGHQGNKFRIYIMTLDEKTKDASDRFFSIGKKSDVIALKKPVIQFTNPKKSNNRTTKEIWVRGKSYTIRWKQIRRTNADLSYIKLILKNRKSGKIHWVTHGTRNTNSFSYRVPNNVPSGLYIFSLMPKGEEFRNQSPEFYVGPNNAVDLVCELKNVRVGWKSKKFFGAEEKKDYFEFEIWIINKGTKILPVVPIVWRVLKHPENYVITQEEAGFSNVYPDRYYKTKVKYTYKEAFKVFWWNTHEKSWGPGPFMIEAEVDPKHTLGEMKMVWDNNIARKKILYNKHIKGTK